MGQLRAFLPASEQSHEVWGFLTMAPGLPILKPASVLV